MMWRPSVETLAAAIAAVVEGDMNSLSTILAASDHELQKAAANRPKLSVSLSAVARVLRDWRSGHYTADNVQQWASFVRRGYVARDSLGGIRPIDIEYDAGHDQHETADDQDEGGRTPRQFYNQAPTRPIGKFLSTAPRRCITLATLDSG